MTKMLAHISGISKLSDEAISVLSKIAKIEYIQIDNKKQLIKSLKTCNIFWFRLNHKLTREVLKNAECKYILCAVTGLDHIDIKACEEFGIKVISLKGEVEFLKEVRATAEHTIGLLLALIRKTKNAFKHSEEGNWDRNQFLGSELYEKKIGILGFGRLGRIVANYATAFGMKVYYFDIEERNTPEAYTRCSSIEELFSLVDVLTIHVPYNEDTHFMINQNLFEIMSSNSIIINTSRGGVVNERDLLVALKNKKISGYATDVLYGEPAIKNHPLIKHATDFENLIITPHIGGNTIESIEKTENFIVNKLYSLFKNE